MNTSCSNEKSVAGGKQPLAVEWLGSESFPVAVKKRFHLVRQALVGRLRYGRLGIDTLTRRPLGGSGRRYGKRHNNRLDGQVTFGSPLVGVPVVRVLSCGTETK